MRQKMLAATLLAAALSGCATTAQPSATVVPTMSLSTNVAPGGPATGAPTTAALAPTTVAGTTAPRIDVGVTASGEVTARRSAELTFRVPGTVAELLVEEGAVVQEGQDLARLNAAELELTVRQAQAQLAQAQAGYERLVDGATSQEIAAARAQVAQAQAGLRTTRGSVTAADIAAAERALQSALARQADLAAGPKAPDMQQSQAAVTQARANLEIQRTNLSAAKTNATLQVEVVANALRDAQKAYSEMYWKNNEMARKLDKYNVELPQAARDAEAQLLRQVESAQARLEQAQLGVTQATQNETDGVRAAEATVRSAEAAMQRLLDGATTDQRAAVDAQVAQAQATLTKLKGDQRAGQIQSAEAGVAGAQANLARITSNPSASALAQASAQVELAQAGLESAKLTLAKGTLKAPFAGVVAQVNIDVGDIAGGASPLPAVQIVDISELRVEVNVSDTDVARVREGMGAVVTIDAIPGQALEGKVTYIAPTATVVGNVRTYAVRVTLDQNHPAGLRAGMSARVAISVDG